MKWTVQGADRETGEERAITVDAPDGAAATERGNEAGVLVASARPSPILTNNPDAQGPAVFETILAVIVGLAGGLAVVFGTMATFATGSLLAILVVIAGLLALILVYLVEILAALRTRR
jgi:hypothetical protein